MKTIRHRAGKAVLLAIAASLLLPVVAQAAEGFATANVNMRSGPSTGYPAVTVIPVGTPVEIHGCLQEAPWCDVSFYDGRGWVAGRYVQAQYQQRRVYVEPDYYGSLGIPFVTFEIGNYWDRHYRTRNFYRDRDYYRRDRDYYRRDRDRYDRDRRPRADDNNFVRPRRNEDDVIIQLPRRDRDRDRDRVDRRRNDDNRDVRRNRDDRRDQFFERNERRNDRDRRERVRRNDDRQNDRQRVERNRNDNRDGERRRPRCRPGDDNCS